MKSFLRQLKPYLLRTMLGTLTRKQSHFANMLAE
jgi:hypothetical protein